MANAILEQPENTNFLSPVGFDFKVKKLPTVNYFVQAINVPSVTLGQGICYFSLFGGWRYWEGGGTQNK